MQAQMAGRHGDMFVVTLTELAEDALNVAN